MLKMIFVRKVNPKSATMERLINASRIQKTLCIMHKNRQHVAKTVSTATDIIHVLH